MKRIVLTLVICVLSGAAVTTAVAWGCALWAPLSQESNVVHSSKDGQVLAPAVLGAAATYANARWFVADPATLVLGQTAVTAGPGLANYQLTLSRRLAGTGFSGEYVGKIAGVSVIRAGWPMLAMRCVGADEFDAGSVTTWNSGWVDRGWLTGRQRITPMIPWPGGVVPLPLQPEPLGFAVDTAMYSAIIGVVVLGPALWRRARRRRSGHCPGCGYDLAGNTTGVCPECGATTARTTA